MGNDKRLDPEMLKNLDLLLDLDLLENEAEWKMLKQMETVEASENKDQEEG